MFLTGFPCFSSLLSLPIQSWSSTLCTVFDAISSNINIDKVFLINLSSKIFIFRDFSFNCKDCLNFSEQLIDLLKFVVIFNQSQATLLRWSLFLLGSETVHISTFLPCSSSTVIYTWFLSACVVATAHRNNFYLYQQNKGKGQMESSYRLAIVGKGFLKLQKNLSLCRDFECWEFWKIC